VNDPRCLIADDHPALLSAVSGYLSQNGFEVVGPVSDGRRAVALAARGVLAPAVAGAEGRREQNAAIDQRQLGSRVVALDHLLPTGTRLRREPFDQFAQHSFGESARVDEHLDQQRLELGQFGSAHDKASLSS